MESVDGLEVVAQFVLPYPHKSISLSDATVASTKPGLLPISGSQILGSPTYATSCIRAFGNLKAG
ncbi:protein of unknown function [Methylocaldum szegediense]|uniref:Uncharacterized protein n=1 Tax=Methylocaldum szegediense TaxID=73780 RepID=A0ABM9HXT4_9GAMM|nr:protein of unknown function [Methylocaldum szegediense]